MGVINFTGHGANVVGSLGSGSLVQDMPTALNFDGASGSYGSVSASGANQIAESTYSCWYYFP